MPTEPRPTKKQRMQIPARISRSRTRGEIVMKGLLIGRFAGGGNGGVEVRKIGDLRYVLNITNGAIRPDDEHRARFDSEILYQCPVGAAERPIAMVRGCLEL